MFSVLVDVCMRASVAYTHFSVDTAFSPIYNCMCVRVCVCVCVCVRVRVCLYPRL